MRRQKAKPATVATGRVSEKNMPCEEHDKSDSTAATQAQAAFKIFLIVLGIAAVVLGGLPK